MDYSQQIKIMYQQKYVNPHQSLLLRQIQYQRSLSHSKTKHKRQSITHRPATSQSASPGKQQNLLLQQQNHVNPLHSINHHLYYASIRPKSHISHSRSIKTAMTPSINSVATRQLKNQCIKLKGRHITASINQLLINDKKHSIIQLINNQKEKNSPSAKTTQILTQRQIKVKRTNKIDSKIDKPAQSIRNAIKYHTNNKRIDFTIGIHQLYDVTSKQIMVIDPWIVTEPQYY